MAEILNLAMPFLGLFLVGNLATWSERASL